MTKEEIIRNGKHLFNDQVDSFQERSDGGFVKAIEGAMDEYAQQEAIAFALWLQENRWFSYTDGKWYYTFEQGTAMGQKTYQKHYVKSSEELYEIYQQSKNKL